MEKFGNDWLCESRFEPYKSLLKQLKDANLRISGRKSDVCAGDIIGDLMLGFWVELFDLRYLLATKLQVPQIKDIFGISAKNIDMKYSRQLHLDLNVIRECRNRVFHHEKIYNHPRFKNIEYLLKKYIYRMDKNKYLSKILHDSFGVVLPPPTTL